MRIIDLTQMVHIDMPVFPGTAQPKFEHLALVEKDGYSVAQITMNYHVGTHMDAPYHMVKGGMTLDKLPWSIFAARVRL